MFAIKDIIYLSSSDSQLPEEPMQLTKECKSKFCRSVDTDLQDFVISNKSIDDTQLQNEASLTNLKERILHRKQHRINKEVSRNNFQLVMAHHL
jgi:hypothetical protein